MVTTTTSTTIQGKEGHPSTSYLLSRYTFLRRLGQGSFGSVFKAIDNTTGIPLAIKMLKHPISSLSSSPLQDCLALPETHALTHIPRHPNIVALNGLVKQGDTLFLLFECMHTSLHQLIFTQPPLPVSQIQNYAIQILKGLRHVHASGFFHRDLKPANILVSGNSLKIADFGSARPLSTPPYLDCVTTRWYRAPEVLLNSQYYGAAVDMWAVGVIVAEMFIGAPLFPGRCVEDQLNLICSLMGDPANRKFDPWTAPTSYITALIPNLTNDSLDFIESLLSWDPTWRPTAAEALAHPFLQRHSTSTPPTRPGESCDLPIRIS